MPSHRCRHPTCTALLPGPAASYCPDHAGLQQPSRHTFYDAHARDAQMKAFYASAAWRRARSIALAARPWCGRCGKPATTVHHRQPAKMFPLLRLGQDNLDPLCAACHSALEQLLCGSK